MKYSIIVSDTPSSDWDAWVDTHPQASLYHRATCPLLIQEVFQHKPLFFEARDASGSLAGVLSIVRQKSLLFGDYATSLPFVNYGGALANSTAVAESLMIEARNAANAWGCKYIEFRDVRRQSGPWSTRTDKVTMLLQLPRSHEDLAKALGSKLRSQVRRADREEASVDVGGARLLSSFYTVFCQNMRQLGTPVYPRRFFEALLCRFPAESVIVTISRNGRPSAAALLILHRQRAEIPWASCTEETKPLGFNMKLYWEALRVAIERGCTSFDFGRSTANSGPYRFKQQWGAQPQQLYWHRWSRDGHAPGDAAIGSSPHGTLFRRASRIWARLPLPIANSIGPMISPSLPW